MMPPTDQEEEKNKKNKYKIFLDEIQKLRAEVSELKEINKTILTSRSVAGNSRVKSVGADQGNFPLMTNHNIYPRDTSSSQFLQPSFPVNQGATITFTAGGINTGIVRNSGIFANRQESNPAYNNGYQPNLVINKNPMKHSHMSSNIHTATYRLEK